MSPPEHPVRFLASLPDEPEESLERQWLQSTIDWLRCGEDKSAPPSIRIKRLRVLTAALETPRFRDRVADIWRRASLDRLLSDAALPEETFLLREISVRLKRRLIPQSERDLDLYSMLESARLTRCDADWIAALSDEDIRPWSSIIRPSREHLHKALRLLAARVASIALSRDLIGALPSLWQNERGEDQSPFYDLLQAVGRNPDDGPAIEEALLRCRMLAGVAHARLDEQGVSANLVFRLDLVILQVERMEALLRLADGREDRRKFTAMLIRGFADSHGTHAMFRDAINRLARRVVEHTGRTGEHCIAASSSEWRAMGLGAIGAGAITAFTALFKYALAATPFAPFWMGVAQSINYGASFLLMQALGWLLASKIPSMTASALATALGRDDGMQELVELIASITRTQFIVTAGNLLGALPVALLIDGFLRLTTGHPFLTHEAGLHGLQGMNPFASFTILFAAITGAFLWLSSLAAGWTANWIAFHRLPEAISCSRSIQRMTSAHFAAKLGATVDHGFSGVVGYIVLGYLLGLLPFIGAFAGIPLEVRHITLSSASVMYALSASFREASPWLMCAAVIGIGVTGVLNFTVSFALGLWLAVRARNLDTRGRRMLLSTLMREIARGPSRFLWKNRTSASVEKRLIKATTA